MFCSSSISMLSYKYLCNISWFIYNHLYLFLIYSLNLIFEHHNLVILGFWFSININFLSQEYKDIIIHIFHSFLHRDTVVSDNDIWIFLFLIFSVFIKYCMNLTYRYLHYFSFKNCNFYSLTFIFHLSEILFISFSFIAFLIKVYCEEESTKIPVLQ